MSRDGERAEQVAVDESQRLWPDPPVPSWPDGERGPMRLLVPPPTPVAPRSEGIERTWREGVDLHGTSFAVLHGRSTHDPVVLRRYAAAVLAAADLIERGGG